MSITNTNPIQFLTTANSLICDNQSACSVSFWLRVETAGLVVGQQQYLVMRGGNLSITSWYIVNTLPVGPAPGTVSYTLRFYFSSGYSTVTVTLNVGQIYHIAATHSPGAQCLYVNGAMVNNTGQAAPFGTSSLSTQGGSAGFGFGTSTQTGSLQSTLSDIAVWNGYTLTQSDVLTILFGTSNPSQIGTSASWFGEWTLSGPIGTTPAIGDAGLNCSDGTHNIATISGTGAAVYSAPLGLTAAAALRSAYVSTSGETVGCLVESTTTSSLTNVTVSLTPPTLYQNGINVGQLVNPWVTGYHNCLLYQLPPGVTVQPTDILSISAQDGWVLTSAGPAVGVTNQAVSNYTGKSVVGTDSLVKTLKPGLNFSEQGSGYYCPFWLPKNMRYRTGSWSGVASYDSTGKPLTLTGTSAWTTLSNFQSSPNGLDNTTYPCLIPGYYAIVADIPRTSTTTFYLAASGTDTVVTEITALKSSGDSNGNGAVRVFNVQYSASPSTANLNVRLNVTTSDAGNAVNFNNLWIAGPGDFSYTLSPGAVTLDRGNPYALGATTLARLANGIGSVRVADGTLGYGVCSSVSDPEQLRSMNDFSLGDGTYKVKLTPTLSSARPWDPTVSPYVYSDMFGTPFTATLAQNITTTPAAGTIETYTISDAATAPVLVGLKLQIDAEIMRVMGVNGTSVTVERGSESTPPASHSAGAIAVLNRLALVSTSFGKYRNAEIVTSAPHNLRSGHALRCSGTWPTFTYADNGTVNWSGAAPQVAFVTGANTYLMVWNTWTTGYSGGNNTIQSTYSLSSAAASLTIPESSGLPYDFDAAFAGSFAGAVYHCNIGYAMNNSCIDAVARMVRDHFPAGREVWIELSDEPWNSMIGAQYGWLWTVSALTNPGGFGLEFYVSWAGQVKQRFIDRFNENGLNRGSEIRLMLNCQRFNTTQANGYLTYAKNNNIPVDALAITAYVNSDSSNPTQRWIWSASDEQVIDLYIHDLWYNNNPGGSIQGPTYQAQLAQVTAYNAATGRKCVLFAYEADVTWAIPPSPSITLSASVLATDSTISVSSAAAVVNGQYIVVDSGANQELMQITAINGTTLSVNRGLAGLALITATSKAHNSGVSVRSCAAERNNDIIYNPNFRQAELDSFALWQQYFTYLNIYAYCRNASGTNQWAVYRYQAQLPGKGDGSDGLADNRTCLACPGKANTKAANVNQDLHNVSVRGQAFLDWMQQAVTHGRKRPRFVPWSRSRHRR